ncbi:MAG: hypothetical protein K8M05_22935 [Deltaproteobacteria bacterium]|nr:hypothetical protein [Kofleriaceae bacterium]
MRDYMESDEAAYDEADVEECARILSEHATATRSVTDRKDALELVRGTVLRLNKLDERCDGTLIETDQRETICTFIIRTGHLRGFNAENEDVTEPWREW